MKKFCQVSNFTLRVVKLVIKLCSYFTSRLYFLVYQLFFKWKLIVSGVVFGKNCTVGSNTRFRITDGGKCVLGENVHFDRLSDITIKYGSLCVGNRVYFGIGLVVVARNKIKIGNDCLFAENVTIRDQDHRFGLGLITSEAGFVTSPIEIGDNVWIGAKATITKGITIGSGSVIGANSVVTQDIPANSIAVGAPARVIRKIDNRSY